MEQLVVATTLQASKDAFTACFGVGYVDCYILVILDICCHRHGLDRMVILHYPANIIGGIEYGDVMHMIRDSLLDSDYGAPLILFSHYPESVLIMDEAQERSQ